ncbi:FMN-dependent oxidoreductase (nitrilotriacetate monooxygenase family) [Saccharopolyspora erythraea NRRL 2338]|uniref:Monooxygenase, NtaA/SnaA/SoxA family n=2 Tax=Saccharopolyspora erythraea TaxID=1836 RepID=A4FDE4_SACEN|nr:LLM class flavin-dependent oxidoreductase [Saccharopolyspora erythraea]EQD84838.1 N5,N10-methylene tetrahydromethanopterin reductase [Saccharopolyspora erythraea D]PFG95809.1 FMN-dependent oxidoreductase (nitrilotriacetate monooxygenase family) [Saccharopolyspora erythraea NRRL 2338]QRK92395.1 LLM class flavin-dependent oxidoreductase [Saccharopolyspora erythraea]CAM02069.1 monooxygenase, NtaA/SnaA/SoxA family [Saccharopolyspora erythraea NRRL 2338]
MSDRPFKLFAFDVQAPAHLTAGSWRNGDDQGHRYAELGYWTDTAKLLEQACFDGIFLADTVGYHDVYAGSPDAAIRDAAQFPINDPALLVSGMAAVTEHLGFGVTSSLTYEQPYSLARKFSTLDHLTGGRVGWNIVTSYSESAARNLGLGKQIPHDRRYDMAEEYMQVCYGLWEYSWQDDAVVRDRESATYAEPGRIRPINHEGEYFQVPGFHLCEPSPQRTPVLFQAGASSRGVAFAGTHAEAVFINTMTPELTRRSVDKVRKAAADAGRDPRSVLITALITVVVAPTDAQAQEKYESYLRSVSYEGALARFAGWTGIDLSSYDPDMPLRYVETDASRSLIEMFSKADPSRTWTPRQIAEFLGIGGTGAVAVGSPQTVAAELRRWQEVADIDGFNLSYTSKPASWVEFIDLALPELRRQELVNEDYDRSAVTLREKLFGAGRNLTRPDHPASALRGLPDDASQHAASALV